MATRVITGKCRLSYEHIWIARASVQGGDPKYSATILIPKTDMKTYEAIKKAMMIETAAKWSTTVPQNLKIPLKDGDRALDKDGKQRRETIGHWIITATSHQRPDIVDKDLNDVIDKSAVYSGCYCRFQVAFQAYDLPTSKGIGCYLNNIQKLDDGDRFGSRQSAKDVFARVYEHEGKLVQDDSPTDAEVDDEDNEAEAQLKADTAFNEMTCKDKKEVDDTGCQACEFKDRCKLLPKKTGKAKKIPF